MSAPYRSTPLATVDVVKTIERLGTYAEVRARGPEALHPLMDELRAMIIRLDPDVVEVPRNGDGAVCFGLGERKMSEAYCYLAAHAAWVNLGFLHADEMDDPAGLLEGTGKRLRHVKVRPADDLAPLEALVRQARERRAAALGR